MFIDSLKKVIFAHPVFYSSIKCKKYILMIKENYYILFMFRKWSVYMINYP